MAQAAAPRLTAIDNHLAAICGAGADAYSFGYVYSGTPQAAAAASASACAFVQPGSAGPGVLQRALAALKQPPVQAS
ncbi:hypothetical protein MNEG_9722, partial [Monoraphidium neglectum]